MRHPYLRGKLRLSPVFFATDDTSTVHDEVQVKIFVEEEDIGITTFF